MGDATDEPAECKLLSGGFAALMQLMLGVIAFSVLVFKRVHEVPQRPLAVWGFDASKQMVGAGFAHIANLLIAILLYQHQLDAQEVLKGVDQCAFYFVNFTLDTTFGVFLNWVFLEAFSLLATRFQWTSVMVPGDYGDPIRIKNWLAQLLSWIVIIFSTKLVIAVFIVALETPLGELAAWAFAPLRPYPRVELALVMIACPVLMNALQFWVQDSFLKKDVRDDCMLVATSTSKAAAAATGERSSGKPASPPSGLGDDGDGDGDDSDSAVVVVGEHASSRSDTAAGDVVAV
ncbi:hypothetical protein PybrP1_007454 [[Pythium] brassicae (nom. inval.)]|nr:hypothetical protein PybrP1_007454 [[Pythium] brassicae (nom. inval.)]